MGTRSVLFGACLLLAVASVPAVAQTAAPSSAGPAAAALVSWLAFDAPPGDESRITDAIAATDSRWHRDASGNLIMTVGTGHPRRLVACGLDHVGFIVSGITDQGYLRLRRSGSARTHPLWDQFHQAQQVRVLTQDGSIPGVAAVDNVHFAAEHRGDTSVVNVDQLWVDIGAQNRQEAEKLGVSLIDPVVRDMQSWTYADLVAGADAGGRAGCAAVASVAHMMADGATSGAGQTVFVLSAQTSFGWSGLSAAAARLGRFDEATVFGAPQLAESNTASISASRFSPGDRGAPRIDAPSISDVTVRVRFPGTLVESVQARDLDSLLAAVRSSAGAASAVTPWVRVPAPRRAITTRDSLSAAADILARLVALPAVDDREAPVRSAIRSALPAWARGGAVQDSAGNLIVAMGPDRDTSVFLAHMDEVAFTVRSFDRNGIVSLTPRGGLNGAAWEGQPALLYLDASQADTRSGGGEATTAPPAIAGVFVPREHAQLRRPDSLRAWFGLDSAQLAAHGVHPGLAVTAYKRGERLGPTRFTARALDDRAGDTALLLAIANIDPAKLEHKVIFVWSVEEELGLFGADAVARTIGTSVHHVYAIDTFVSSDTPLEQPLFAFAPLGAGPVLRASDDGMVMLRSERDRIIGIARDHHLPLQVGTTKGSTDAVPFVARGAIGAQLGWPGRYSHSPAEVLDLRDLKSLARMVEVLAGR